MQINHHHTRNNRGNSPRQKTQLVLDNWLKGLRSVEEVLENSNAQLYRVEHQEDATSELISAEHEYDESRWQDDGGESG